jgi:Uma2 family endonuclease
METTTTKKIWTDEELMQLPKDGYKYELVDGDIIMSPTRWEHSDICAELIMLLRAHVKKYKLGTVPVSEMGYRMREGNIRCPDASFIAKERLVGLKRPPRTFFNGAPDLAVEVLSPEDTMEEVHKKLVEYFDNGTRLAWVVNPDEQTVFVYHSPESAKELTGNDVLDGEDMLPDFTLPVSQLFEEWHF